MLPTLAPTDHLYRRLTRDAESLASADVLMVRHGIHTVDSTTSYQMSVKILNLFDAAVVVAGMLEEAKV